MSGSTHWHSIIDVTLTHYLPSPHNNTHLNLGKGALPSQLRPPPLGRIYKVIPIISMLYLKIFGPRCMVWAN